MEPTLTARQGRWIIALLGAVALLLVALVGGLGYAASQVLRHFAQPPGEARPVANAAEQARKTTEELSQRQDEVAASLADVAGDTQRQLRALRSRRARMERLPSGPLRKLDAGIQLGQLTEDTTLALLENLTRTEAALAQAVRPLPTQREVTATPPPSAPAAAQEQSEARGRQRSEARRPRR